ncbi:hypothetical protein ED236_06975 [Pseudomethylobacillus aquaticus]|uniref:Uncharacterized protein n=1 Tax=Pseudomethylobacillus aquaticus TaxID=2676064 RepID=A0A3N0V0F3_9PROT|nr:hypothetical protein [Pseudomethylobacillus aquaticus]ROH86185.1 hypothetical protein ED236_06975 [Pseudomethylobacillus aquaticus]
MKKLAVVVAVIVSVYLGMHYFGSMQDGSKDSATLDHALVTAIDHCRDISVRATASRTAIVEFQRLEIAGVQASSFQRCMQDQGYQQNPDWLQQARQQRSANAGSAPSEALSDEAALEAMRREHMNSVTLLQGLPSYWRKASGTTTPAAK